VLKKLNKKLLKNVSQRQACRSLDQPRSTQRYQAQQRNGERALRDRMRELALRNPRYGYRRIAALLREEGFRVNLKRVHRLWRSEGLKVPQKQHKRTRLITSASGSSENAIARRRAQRPNDVWSFDFCHDRTADGKSLKIFSVIDEFTRQCLAIRTERSITGSAVVAVLKKLASIHQMPPRHVRCDNGPEFICRALRAWLKRSKVCALYIAPGSPWENGYAESYHARLRDELLNREEFGSLIEARALLENWRHEYNHQRPHGALGYRTPDAFAASWAGAGDPVAPAQPCSATLRMAGQEQEQLSWETVAQ